MSDAAVEAFSGAGESLGVVCWRIEKFQPVKQDNVGVFAEGDSYICLNTFTKSNSKRYNLHFWLGKDTSKDEAGTAAVLSSVLDEQLGGQAVQYREIQGKESPLFLQMFPSGVQYQSGGVDSGFTHVEKDQYKTRLLHIRGKRNVRVAEVPLSVSSLNSGDCFVLDDGLVLFQWNGKEANRAEKSKALDVTAGIKNNLRSGKAVVFVVEQGEGSDEEKAFFEGLGIDDLSKVNVPASLPPAAEALFAPPVLYKAESGGFKEVAKGSLEKGMLESDGVFIVHASGTVSVWLGKEVSAEDKKAAFVTGSKFLSDKGLGEDTEIQVVKEKLEVPLFKQNFQKWEEEEFKSTFETAREATGRKETPEVDIGAMVAGKTGDAVKDIKDDGSGSVKVWRIENFKMKELPEEEYGHFYAGDSYVIKYTYTKSGSENHVIYFWQGRDSSADEKGTAAAMATTMDEELGGMPVQVRVVQNKEPNHFFRVFNGGMIVSLGGINNEDEGKSGPNGEKLYHIKATDDFDAHAVQVTTSAKSLNSGDSFVLVDKDSAVVWHGKMSSEQEKGYSEKIAPKIAGSKEIKSVAEGEEDSSFWDMLGGKEDYPSIGELPPPEMPPRLFQVSDAVTGGSGIVVQEIFNFDQEDLDDDDVMLLDTYREVFVWVGKSAREEEKKEAFDLAGKYLEKASQMSGRDASVPVTEVKSGLEPPMFYCHFLGWDDTRNKDFVDPYKEKLKKLNAEQDQKNALAELAESRKRRFKDPLAKKAETETKEESAEPPAPTTPPPDANYKFVPGKDVFPLDELKGMKGEDGIDPAKKELYLSDEEFASVFKMGKSEFSSLAGWKQTRAKKDCGLF